MKYLLDTNTCIRFLNGRAPSIREKMLHLDDKDIVLSAITKAEMFLGAAKSQTPEASRAKQENFFKRFESLAFDDDCADAYGTLRAKLEKQGTPIGANDMLIAAIALTHNLILVTHNTGEFSRIAELKLEDWEEPS